MACLNVTVNGYGSASIQSAAVLRSEWQAARPIAPVDAVDRLFYFILRPHAACLTATCELFNATCICEVDALDGTQDCLLETCSFPEALFSNNLTKTACGSSVRDRTVQLNVMTLILGSVAAFVVGIRLVFKHFFSSKKRLETDDWTMLTAFPVGLSCMAVTIGGLSTHGLGKDMWSLSQSDLTAFGLYFYISQFLYITLMTQVKLTFCFFYLNIFSGVTIRRLLWFAVVFHILFCASFLILTVFECAPIRYAWDRYELADSPTTEGRCISLNAAGWANGAIGAASDIFLLGMPLSQVRRLKLHWKKKIGVALMFLTGAIATVVSFLRLTSIARYANTANPTWDQWSIVWWSTIEVCTGLVCTSLPALRLILVRLYPRTFSSENHQSRIAIKFPTLKFPELPLCSGHALPIRPGNRNTLSSLVIATHSQPIELRRPGTETETSQTALSKSC